MRQSQNGLKHIYALHKVSFPQPPSEESNISVIERMDWENMTDVDQLICFRKDKALLILEQNHIIPPFSSSELVKISPSLSRQINVQSKSI